MGLDMGVFSFAIIFGIYLVIYIKENDSLVLLNSNAQLWNPKCQS